MKKIIKTLGLVLATIMLLVQNAKAQLPLVQGDAVVTHSPYNSTTSAPHIVVRTIRTSNTTGALIDGHPWLNPPKPLNGNYNNWVEGTLGAVFGITLDDNANPNIYVSNTQLYTATITSKIWRLDGTTGANTLVHDFNNANRSLGNLKYLRTGGTENIYVSNWENGAIERLTGNSASTATWAPQNAFNPKFGLALDDPKYIPYGIALRTIGSGSFRLYYAKISKTSPFSTNDIWSVDLQPNGDFLPLTETQEITPSITTTQPISDIAFSSDGKRMLLGQQTWYGFASLNAHGSSVVEFSISSGHTWIPSLNVYPSGTYSAHTNAVGGVSYSNNILQNDQTKLGCDSTVWFTSDAATLYSTVTTSVVYGIVGMKIRANGFNDALFIDEDDVATCCSDKTKLGDVEVYKMPLDCNPCSCGKWESGPTLNDNLIPGVPIYHLPLEATPQGKAIGSAGSSGPVGPVPTIQLYPIQFVQGNVFGLINDVYICSGDCGATYSWNITSDLTSTVVASGVTLPIDLSQYNGVLKCGKFTLTIKAKCGKSDCGGQVIPITIICEPPSCCKDEITVTKTHSSIHAVANFPVPGDPYSVGAATFSINTPAAMSELRVSVEDFNLSAGSPNCLVCNNRPVNWGNILGATLNGSIPGELTTGGGPGSGSTSADYREVVFNTGSPISLNPGSFSIKFSLPEVTGLECCTIKVHLCLKFTFKNTKCVECVRLVCGDFDLVTKKGGPVLNSSDTKFKTFDVNH